MKVRFKPAFSKETFEKFIGEIAKIINQKECGSILNLARRDQLYRVKQLQDNQKSLRKIINNKKSVHFLFLDLSSQMIEDEIDLKKYLEKNIKNSKNNIVLFILDADKLFDERSLLLGGIDGLRHQIPNISIVYFFQKNIFLNKYLKKFARFTTSYQNIIIFPYYQREDCQVFIAQLEQRFNIKVRKKTSNLILDRCGGHFWLIKQAVRQLAKDKVINNIFNNEDMIFRLKVIADEFEPEEKDLLEKIIKEDFNFLSEEKDILTYFLKNRFLYKRDRQYFFSIPILKDYLTEQISQKNQIKINERKQIVINNIITDGYFSKKEKRMMIFFIKNINKIVRREEVAKEIWREDYQELYTDWALDQFIRRLRLKFIKLGLDQKMIKTKKNQGFIFNK